MSTQHGPTMHDAPPRAPTTTATTRPVSGGLAADAAARRASRQPPKLRRSLRWAGGAFGGVFAVGAVCASCGVVPLGLVLAAAGAASLTAGLGVALFALGSAMLVAVLARSRRRGQPPEACCSPAALAATDQGEATRTSSTVL